MSINIPEESVVEEDEDFQAEDLEKEDKRFYERFAALTALYANSSMPAPPPPTELNSLESEVAVRK